jgi:hypothetical protein
MGAAMTEILMMTTVIDTVTLALAVDLAVVFGWLRRLR